MTGQQRDIIAAVLADLDDGWTELGAAARNAVTVDEVRRICGARGHDVVHIGGEFPPECWDCGATVEESTPCT